MLALNRNLIDGAIDVAAVGRCRGGGAIGHIFLLHNYGALCQLLLCQFGGLHSVYVFGYFDRVGWACAQVRMADVSQLAMSPCGNYGVRRVSGPNLVWSYPSLAWVT